MAIVGTGALPISAAYNDFTTGVFNVRNFGAVGDGVTNDTPAFAGAIAAAKPNAGIVYVPSISNIGTPYLLGPFGAMTSTAILSLNGRVSLIGGGHSDGPILKLGNGANRSLIEMDEQNQGNRIEHLRLEGNKANQTGTSHGIRLRNITPIAYQDSRYHFQDLLIQSFLTSGVYSEAAASELRMLFVIVRSCGVNGFDINGSDTRLIECEAGFNGGRGAYFTAGFNRISGGGYFSNGSFNIHVGASANGVWISEADIDSSAIDNVKIDGPNTSIVHCISRDPGQSADLTYSHIVADPSLHGLVILGNRFKAKSKTNQARYCISVNGAIGDGITGPNTYEALSFGTDRTLIFGTPGPDFFYGRPRRQVTLPYSASIATDLTKGDDFAIVATNGTAFTILNPTNGSVAPDSSIVTYDIVNSSGGALGAVTWGGNFLMAGAFTNPANGKRRTITFKTNGVFMIELNRAAADI